MPDTFQHVANLQASERRFHPRQQVLYSLIELEDDNGGIILNISESGLAMAAVRSLTTDPLDMRFQLSQSSVWIKAQGRIAWTNASRQTAGVQFLGLPYEERILIRRWLASIEHVNTTATMSPPVEEIAPPIKSAPAALEQTLPESATAPEVMEDSKQVTAPKDPAGLPTIGEGGEDLETISQYFGAAFDTETIVHRHIPMGENALEKPPAAQESANAASTPGFETEHLIKNPEQDLVNPDHVLSTTREPRDLETDWQDFQATSAMPEVAGNTVPDTRPPLYLSYEKEPPVRVTTGREPTRPRHSFQWAGILLVVLALIAFFFLGRLFRRSGNNRPSVAVQNAASQPALPSPEPVAPKNPPVSTDLKQPLDRPGFVLQVGAMTHKENADALAATLQSKQFPAFISHHGNERFYLVVVGPYGDLDSAARVKTDLKEGGFESIQRPWNPPAEQASPSAGSH